MKLSAHLEDKYISNTPNEPTCSSDVAGLRGYAAYRIRGSIGISISIFGDRKGYFWGSERL